MTIYTHTCSCGQTYKNSDIDPYFCPSCVAERKALAKEIDAKMKNRPRKNVIPSDYQILMEKGKSTGSATFVRATDLGINFN